MIIKEEKKAAAQKQLPTKFVAERNHGLTQVIKVCHPDENGYFKENSWTADFQEMSPGVNDFGARLPVVGFYDCAWHPMVQRNKATEQEIARMMIESTGCIRDFIDYDRWLERQNAEAKIRHDAQNSQAELDGASDMSDRLRLFGIG